MVLNTYGVEHVRYFFFYHDLGGGKCVTSAWSPLGNFLEGQAHPNLHRTKFFYFFDEVFLCLLSGGLGFFTEVMFIFEKFSVSLYIHIYIFYIFFHCTHCRSTHNSSTICFFCVCSGFSLASWCWTGCPKETIAI